MRLAVAALIAAGMATQALWAALASAQGPAREPRPIPSRRTALTIPFRITPTTNPHDQPVEVQLLVSTNRGLAWKHAGSAAPQAGKIAYSAGGDGEYWFCVKTKDAAGRVRPPGPPVAELRVLVDATPPQLRVNAWRGVDGDVTVRWDATDANLNPQTFKIEYRRSGANEPWQPLSVTPPLPDARGSYADAITWKSTTAVDVQVEIADAAGNVSRQVVEASAATSTPLTGMSAAPQNGGAPPSGVGMQIVPPPTGAQPPLGAAPNQPGATPASRPASKAPAADGGTSPQSSSGFGAPPASATGFGSAFSHGARPPVDLPWKTETSSSTPWPAEGAAAPTRLRSWDAGATGSPASSGSGPPARIESHDPFAAHQQSAAPAAGGATPPWPPIAQRVSPFPSRGHERGAPIGPGTGAVAAPGAAPPGAPSASASPPSPSSFANPFALTAGPTTPSSSIANGAARACVVNARVLDIAYDLGPTNPGDVRAVELWGTNDAGQTWRKIAADDDNRSPVTVRVEADGTYGFRLMVQKQGGPIEFPPASGQAPELVVEVDQAEPRCQITQVDQLAGPRSSELVINWIASDRRLAERPVTLRWSQRADGPWRTIAVGLENTGSHTWQMPEGLPAELYLRLEVRDAADNVGQFTTDKPVTPQATQPTGRIRSAVPGGSAPARVTDQRATPRMYFFR